MTNSYTKQTTIKKAISFEGIGVHSGNAIHGKLCPAEPNTGIVFVRTDQPEPNTIPALWEYVTNTQLCTQVGATPKVTVGTIEHLLSACAGYEIDNLRIELDGPEVPIMDGSASPFVKMIEKSGLTQQNAFKKVIAIKKQVSIFQDDMMAKISPAHGFSLHVEIDFTSQAIGKQTLMTHMSPRQYKKLISSARTFGFTKDLETLNKMGLAKGASLDNSIAIQDHKILNEEGLRYKDEFVRHKVLDAIGDLYLSGHKIIGHFEGIKNGHALNYSLVKSLMEDETAWSYSLLPLSTKATTSASTPEKVLPVSVPIENIAK